MLDHRLDVELLGLLLCQFLPQLVGLRHGQVRLDRQLLSSLLFFLVPRLSANDLLLLGLLDFQRQVIVEHHIR